MIESKSWNWDIVDKNDFYWNSPAPEVFYLAENWKSKNITHILDVGCGWGRNAIFLAKHDFKLDGFDLSKTSVDTTIEKAKAQGIDFSHFKLADMLTLLNPFFSRLNENLVLYLLNKLVL